MKAFYSYISGVGPNISAVDEGDDETEEEASFNEKSELGNAVSNTLDALLGEELLKNLRFGVLGNGDVLEDELANRETLEIAGLPPLPLSIVVFRGVVHLKGLVLLSFSHVV